MLSWSATVTQVVRVLAWFWSKPKSPPLDRAGPWLEGQSRPGTARSELLEYSCSVLWAEEGLAIWI